MARQYLHAHGWKDQNNSEYSSRYHRHYMVT